MADGSDIGWIALGIAVVAMFAWYFWHTAVSMLRYGKSVSDYLDTRSERLRQKLEYEAIHGRPPLWYRLVQRLMILIVIAGAAALVWTKFRSA
ncbi:MAG: hypothetical protein JWM58_3757 [Rhizobium sp.]|nr:hypothetical protein [Rhizobium sp.]